MSKIQLTDVQWMFIRPLLPPPARTGRPRADDRRTIEGILYVLITGCRWQDLPREYGSPTTAWRRLKRWGEEGVWECIWRATLAALDRHGRLDWSIVFLDGSFVPAKKGGEQVGLTRKGKGTKWMLVTDGTGLPLGFHLDGANRTEVRLAEQTLDTIWVARPRGRPKQRPQKLVADRGYDSRAFRRVLRGRGIRMCIPSKRRPATWKAKRGRPVVARNEDYRRRFTVERSFAELSQFPATPDSLGAAHERLSQLVHGGCAAALPAPVVQYHLSARQAVGALLEADGPMCWPQKRSTRQSTSRSLRSITAGIASPLSVGALVA